MNELKLADVMRYLAEYEPQIIFIGTIIIAILVSVAMVYLLIRYILSKRAAIAADKDDIPKIKLKTPEPAAVEDDQIFEAALLPPILDDEPDDEEAGTPVFENQAVEAPPAPAGKAVVDVAPKPIAPAPVAKPIIITPAIPAKPAPSVAAGPHMPQESVLRRHAITHIRYMLETVHAPRPTESVLRRHYEQLISSQVEECVESAVHFEKLLARYCEHRKAAFQTR